MFLRSLSLTVLFILASSSLLLAGPVNDQAALTGLKSAKAILDMRATDTEKLLFNLNLLVETWEGMARQGVKGEMIVAFRGPGVKLLTSAAIDDEALDLLRDLKKKGVRLEVCSIALRTFNVDPAALVPELLVVGNVLTSLIAYQNKGYALIVIN